MLNFYTSQDVEERSPEASNLEPNLKEPPQSLYERRSTKMPCLQSVDSENSKFRIRKLPIIRTDINNTETLRSISPRSN